MIEKKSIEKTREEFSIEFGDVNGIKLYEILQPKQEDRNSSKSKK